MIARVWIVALGFVDNDLFDVEGRIVGALDAEASRKTVAREKMLM